MTGRVNADYEAIVEIEVRLGEAKVQVQAVVDTGFSEFLTLPASRLLALGTKVEREEPVVLGDGSVALMDVHVVEVLWFGEWRSVKTYASEGETLVGMKLLDGHELRMEVAPGGEVGVTPL